MHDSVVVRHARIALSSVLIVVLRASPALASAPPSEAPSEAADDRARTRLFAPKRDIVGNVDFNGYADSRGFANLTLNILALLPYGFEYFGFVDFVGYPWLWSNNDVTFPDIYSEHNLIWGPVPKLVPLDFIAQWGIVNPVSLSDHLRPGLRWRISDTRGIARVCTFLHLWAVTNVFVADISAATGDGNGYPFQLSHVYRWDIAPNKLQQRLYVSGFLDQNICVGECLLDPNDPLAGAKHHRIVTEHQLGVRIAGGFHIVGEVRYNDDYLPGFGFAGGLEYVINFPSR